MLILLSYEIAGLNFVPWDLAYEEADMELSTAKWMDLFLAAVDDGSQNKS